MFMEWCSRWYFAGILSTTGVYFNLYARAMGHGGVFVATEKGDLSYF